MFHTVYNSYESRPRGRDYIGKHSTENPYDGYKGSFKDKEFDPDSKIVMAYSRTAEGAAWFEINFHNVFNVALDPQYVNRAKQTSTKFDRTGIPTSDDHKKRIGESLKGEKNPNFGKPRSEEVKQKIRKKKTGILRSEEVKRKLSEAHIGIQCGKDNPKSKKVKVICPDGTVNEYHCVRDVANSLRYDSSTLGKLCRKGQTVTRGRLVGYSFSYMGEVL